MYLFVTGFNFEDKFDEQLNPANHNVQSIITDPAASEDCL
jgi:hypothetical protein